MVLGNSHGHPQTPLTVLQVPGAGACKSDLHIGKCGHKAKECTAGKPNCPLCEALGVPAGHLMGGMACAPPPNQKKKSPGPRNK
jgi:hypothetical protein